MKFLSQAFGTEKLRQSNNIQLVFLTSLVYYFHPRSLIECQGYGNSILCSLSLLYSAHILEVHTNG